MFYPRLAFLILPFTRLELPGWGKLYQFFRVGGIQNNSLWKDAPTKMIKEKWSGYWLKLNLDNWSERHTYFLGRYYDLDLQLVMAQLLKPGDRFIDIGANIGMLTLKGASLVGKLGRVDSFEPNPNCCKRIRDNLELNQINNVYLHQVGLSDKTDTLKLSIITEHSGMGTLSELRQEDQKLVTDVFDVSVLRGDEIVMQDLTPVKFIKIDVEGYELNVLKGLYKSLNTWHPIVITEVVNEWLKRSGTNRSEICKFMDELGYFPYGLSTKRRFLKHDLSLERIKEQEVENSQFTDFLWIHPESLGKETLTKFMC
jgi:FkbM family methyltransferase